MLFKNIFRSVKKYYTLLFKSTTSFYEIKTKAERKKKVQEYLREFVSQHFTNNDVHGKFVGIQPDELWKYIGRIVVPEYFSKAYCSYECKKYTDLLYGCVYNYSEKKAETLYHSTVLKEIFEFFFKSDEFKQMLDTDETLKKHKELYIEKATEILNGFSKHN